MTLRNMKFKELQSSKENIIPLWLCNKCLRPFRNFIGILEPSKKCEESVKVFLRLGKIQNEGSTKALFVWIPCLLYSHQMQNSEFCQHGFFWPKELKMHSESFTFQCLFNESNWKAKFCPESLQNSAYSFFHSDVTMPPPSNRWRWILN